MGDALEPRGCLRPMWRLLVRATVEVRRGPGCVGSVVRRREGETRQGLAKGAAQVELSKAGRATGLEAARVREGAGAPGLAKGRAWQGVGKAGRGNCAREGLSVARARERLGAATAREGWDTRGLVKARRSKNFGHFTAKFGIPGRPGAREVGTCCRALCRCTAAECRGSVLLTQKFQRPLVGAGGEGGLARGVGTTLAGEVGVQVGFGLVPGGPFGGAGFGGGAAQGQCGHFDQDVHPRSSSTM